jgi:isoleucyl-tRNA synthetase
MIKVRQPCKGNDSVLDEIQSEIEAVSDLKAEVNVKEILLDDASGVLVKQIKPNFKDFKPCFEKIWSDF